MSNNSCDAAHVGQGKPGLTVGVSGKNEQLSLAIMYTGCQLSAV